MSTHVPLVDLHWQHQQIACEVEPAILDVVRSAAFVKGPAVAAFEQAFAQYCHVSHAVGVANGTEAIELALRALPLVAGTAVVLPANTFIATAEAVVRAGLRPVLHDCDPAHLLLDPHGLADVIRHHRAGAVIAVHLFGQLAPMELITAIAAAEGCAVVEDAAQSQGATRHGRPMGSWGQLAATSFYPGKNLGAYGDAGAVLTSDGSLAHRVRLLADHGSTVRYRHEVVGMNSRLDTIQAVVLAAKLARLDGWNGLRRQAAERYRCLLGTVEGVELPTEAAGNRHVWHLYPVRVAERDRVLQRLVDAGIGAGVHYPQPVHLQPAFADLGLGVGAFSVAEAAAGELLSLPLYPGITATQQERVAEALIASLS